MRRRDWEILGKAWSDSVNAALGNSSTVPFVVGDICPHCAEDIHCKKEFNELRTIEGGKVFCKCWCVPKPNLWVKWNRFLDRTF